MSEESLLTNDSSLLDDEDFFIKPVKKKKILFLSDHPLAPSGVGVQARFLIEGLIKTGRYSFRCLGGAMKHANYDTVAVNADFVIKPVDGFGNKEIIKSILYSEKPDAIILFTDPRQFIWLWEMADEIRQVCPIAYWHVWDNDPYPKFNFSWYASTDLINCLSYKTYELVKPNFPEKTNYIPHAFPKNVYFPIPEQNSKQLTKQHFGDKADWFKVLWVNRNATRKMPADLFDAWKLFLDNLENKYGHRKACLIMHTEPADPEGPNLFAVSEMLGLQDNVWFSTQKLQFNEMNVLHNITDCCVNISKNEGFGLSTMISMMCGKPIVALKTGGMTRQVVDPIDGSEHGVGIEPAKRSLVGSQLVPYIYEDYCTKEQVADAFMKIHDMSDNDKKEMAIKTISYVEREFNFDNVINLWDKTLTDTVDNFNKNKSNKWSLKLIPSVDTSKKVIGGSNMNNVQTPKVEKSLIDIEKQIKSNFVAKKIERKSK